MERKWEMQGGGGGLGGNSSGGPIMMVPSSSSSHNPNATNNGNNNNNTLFDYHPRHIFSSPFMLQDNNSAAATFTGCYLMDSAAPNNGASSSGSAVKAKIMAHPHYHRLLAAYINCQKIGAPPEVVARLEEAYVTMGASRGGSSGSSAIGQDPALDQFMEAYCEMLGKYEQELAKPFKEAMHFLTKIEYQFKALTVSSLDSSACPDPMDGNASSEEEVHLNNGLVDPQAEDRKLKGQLLRKYSGYLGNLKQEFMKKRKKGKLPKEARQQLMEWWSKNYKWPYPSESQKVALAEATGLDQKQINNWFINQRKRHWKPSDEMQFVMMDAAAAHHPHYYMDNVYGNPFPMDISPQFL
ncbi:hypothetical protein ACET3Z_026134 [Daucus carota]